VLGVCVAPPGLSVCLLPVNRQEVSHISPHNFPTGNSLRKFKLRAHVAGGM
jgi:hypothetical protein